MKRKKKFEGCNGWSHFLIEGHCLYGWEHDPKDWKGEGPMPTKPPKYCKKNGHYNVRCPECPFFGWTNNNLKKKFLRNILIQIHKEVMK